MCGRVEAVAGWVKARNTLLEDRQGQSTIYKHFVKSQAEMKAEIERLDEMINAVLRLERP